jgi:hypothetical protein
MLARSLTQPPSRTTAYEFGKRILIQRRCALCAGSGLITRAGGSGASGSGSGMQLQRKCTACGGFLPWVSWELFLSSAPGNGGVVRPPKGQTSVLYDVAAATAASEDDAAVAAIVAREAQERERESDGKV